MVPPITKIMKCYPPSCSRQILKLLAQVSSCSALSEGCNAETKVLVLQRKQCGSPLLSHSHTGKRGSF